MGGNTSDFTGSKGSVTDSLVPDTTAYSKRSIKVHWSTYTYIQYIHTVHTQVRGCYACITTVAHLNFA